MAAKWFHPGMASHYDTLHQLFYIYDLVVVCQEIDTAHITL